MPDIPVLSDERLQELRDAISTSKRFANETWEQVAAQMDVASEFSVKNFCRGKTKRLDQNLILGALNYLRNHQNAFVQSFLNINHSWIVQKANESFATIDLFVSRIFSPDVQATEQFIQRFRGKYLCVRFSESNKKFLFMFAQIFLPYSTIIPTYRLIYKQSDGKKRHGGGVVGPIGDGTVMTQGYIADNVYQMRRTGYLEPVWKRSLQGIVCGTRSGGGTFFSRVAFMRMPDDASITDLISLAVPSDTVPWSRLNKIDTTGRLSIEAMTKFVEEGPKYFYQNEAH